MDERRRDKSILITTLLVFQILFIIVLVSIVSLNTTDDKIGQTEYDRQPTISIEGMSNSSQKPWN